MAEQYNSNFTGPEIDAILGSAVRYDAAQSLTTEQQAQARGNIGAALDGYGLGSNEGQTAMDFDQLTKNGWYTTRPETANAPVDPVSSQRTLIGALHVVSRSLNSVVVQTLYVWQNSVGFNRSGTLRRIRRNGTWEEWEWIDPPMELTVEYRTTERYLGKPVYCKLVNCGEIAGDKTVAHGISSMSRCIFAQGNYLGASLPMIVNRSLSDTQTVYISSVSNTAITIICGANITGGTCYVQVKYTKTTD